MKTPAKTASAGPNPKSEIRNPKEATKINPNPRSRRRKGLKAESRTRTITRTKEWGEGARYRHGKIARLPVGIREALNRGLAQGAGGPRLLEWLNGLPGTQAVLKQHFNGQPVSQQNLSQWRQGGFRDWLLKLETREVFQEFASGQQELAGLELAEKLALWLGSRYVVLAGYLEQQSPEESWPVLRQMCRDVAALRRGDHRVREIRFKEEKQHKLTNQEHRDWALQPGRLEGLRQEAEERSQREEERSRQIEFAIFGTLGGNDPERMAWEARKRGMSVEELEAEQRAMMAPWMRPPPAAEAPNTRLQAPEKHQEPNTGVQGLGEKEVQGSLHTATSQSRNGKTRGNKVEQSETKCDAQGENGSLKAGETELRTTTRTSTKEETAAAEASPGAEAPSAKHQAPEKDKTSSTNIQAPEKHQGPVAKRGAGDDPCPMTKAKGISKSEIRDGEAVGEERCPQKGGSDGAHGVAVLRSEAAARPARPAPAESMLRYRCYCGAKGRMGAAECPHCHLRWSKAMPVCPCHHSVGTGCHEARAAYPADSSETEKEKTPANV